MNIDFPIQLDILDFIFKGIAIGIIASAPMGPVGILCIQRTLNKGRWYGLMTGVGAAVSDIIYALTVGLGMGFIMEPLQNPKYQFFLQISGSVILLLFGLFCFRSNPAKKLPHHAKNKGKGSLLNNGLTAFLVTFSNPLIIFLSWQPLHSSPSCNPHVPLRHVWVSLAFRWVHCCGGMG